MGRLNWKYALIMIILGLIFGIKILQLTAGKRQALWAIFARMTFLEEKSIDLFYKERNALLNDPMQPKRVLLFAYMRGGSSLLGDVFDKNTKAMYWYEPGSAMYSYMYGVDYWYVPQDATYQHNLLPRPIPDFEKEELASLINRMMCGKYEQLPTEVHTTYINHESKFLSKYHKCYNNRIWASDSRTCKRPLKNICPRNIAEHRGPQKCYNTIKYLRENPTLREIPDENILKKHNMNVSNEEFKMFLRHRGCLQKHQKAGNKCQDDLKVVLENVDIHAAKMIRLTMDSVETIIKKNPDLFVVHYIRDPRGVVISRKSAGLLWKVLDKDLENEAIILCEKMLHDILLYKDLERKYPGVFMQLRYEDIALHPIESSRKIYSFIGAPYPESVRTWFSTGMQSNQTKETIGNTVRKNSTATAFSWRKKMPRAMARNIYRKCKPFYNETKYPL